MNKEKFIEKYDFETLTSKLQYMDFADEGIVFWKKDSFISIGMKNEYFNGCVGEDNEILIRANLLQLKQFRIDDILYRLYYYQPPKHSKINTEEMRRIQKIENKEQLFTEINKWPWFNNTNQKDILVNNNSSTDLPVKITTMLDIHGSCVSRDIFNFVEFENVILGQYFARQSFISSVSTGFSEEYQQSNYHHHFKES